METQKILTADVLDIIFEGRNKIYGAYELRKNYNKRITTALACMAGSLLLIYATYLLTNGAKEKEVTQWVSDPVELIEVHPPVEQKNTTATTAGERKTKRNTNSKKCYAADCKRSEA